MGRISVTADIWSDPCMRPFLACTAHWIAEGENPALRLKTALIAFHHLPRSHTGVNITTALISLFDRAGITDNVSLDPQLGPFLLHDYFQIGHFTLDNAANNKTAMAELERLLGARGIDFDPQFAHHVLTPRPQYMLKACNRRLRFHQPHFNC